MFSLFFGLSRPISTWNEARMMFINFLNFFATFFRILLLGSGKNNSEREKNFLSFSACPDPFRLVMMPGWCFWLFLLFFCEFKTWVEKKRFRSRKICSLVFSFPNPSRLEIQPRWCFWIFFLFFWEFSSSGRVKTVPNKKIFLSFFRPLPTRFGLTFQDDFFFF